MISQSQESSAVWAVPLAILTAINWIPLLLPVAPLVGEGVTSTVGVLAGVAVGVTPIVGVGFVGVGVADGEDWTVGLTCGVGLTGTGV